MAWTLNASGSQTAVIGTEHTLQTSTTNGTYVFQVDTTNMALGDILELRISTITLAAGASTQMYQMSFAGIQVNPSVQSMAVASDISIKVTLKQTAGTGRVFPWKLLVQ